MDLGIEARKDTLLLRIQKTELIRHFITSLARSLHFICCSQVSVNVLVNNLITPRKYYVEILSRSHYYTGLEICHVKI